MRWALKAATSIVLGILAVAGLLKLADVSVFIDSLRAWSILPVWSHKPIGVAIPTLELAAGLGWFVGRWRRAWCGLGGVLYAAFAVAHAAQAYAGVHPHCACAGVLSDAIRLTESAASMTAITACAGGWCVGVASWWPVGFRRPVRVGAAGACEGPPLPERRLRAFTLVETLVVLCAVAILVASSLPSLARARDSAKAVKALSDLRGLGVGMAAYCGDFGDAWPCITSPLASHTVLRADRYVETVPYFSATYKWHLPLASGYFGVPWWSPLFASPYVRDGSDNAWYWYSAAFIASVEYWQQASRVGPVQWGATKASAVLFPTQKALLAMVNLYRGDASEMANPMPLSLCDGSARAVALGDINWGYPNGEGQWPGCVQPHALPPLHTIGGVRGRDLP